MTLLLFAGKMFVCSGLFYGYYCLFLRNRKFHHYNRFYLLFATALSCILPFLKIPVMTGTNYNSTLYPVLNVVTGNFAEPETMAAGTDPFGFTLFSLQNITWLVYIAGAAFLLFTMLRSIHYILSLKRKYPSRKWQHIKFYNTIEEGTPFSFFRSIFWNKNIEFNSLQGQQILSHELFHVRHLHTADILFMELACIAGWFNPFFHMAARELKAIHEFLADKYASSGHDKCDYAELLVTHTAVAQNLTITNNFFNNHLKRRITMLTNFSNTRHGYRSRIMALPVAVILFCFFSLHATMPPVNNKTGVPSVPVILVIDPGHGGIDDGAISAAGIREKQLCLDISRKIKQLGKEYNINVILTRNTDVLPGNSTTSPEALKKRVAITAEARADLFISIHINSADSEKKSGIEVMIPSVERNSAFIDKSTLAGSILTASLKNVYTVAPDLKSMQNKGLYVLDHAPCPALYVSCGYLSNSKDLAFISSPVNQEKIARSVLEGVVRYGAL